MKVWWSKKSVLDVATQIYEDMPSGIRTQLLEKKYAGQVISVSKAGPGGAVHYRDDVINNKLFLEAMIKKWPQIVGSGYMYADVIMALDLLFHGNLLTPQALETKGTLAIQAGVLIKGLVGKLRALRRQASTSHKEEIQDLKDILVTKPKDQRVERSEETLGHKKSEVLEQLKEPLLDAEPEDPDALLLDAESEDLDASLLDAEPEDPDASLLDAELEDPDASLLDAEGADASLLDEEPEDPDASLLEAVDSESEDLDGSLLDEPENLEVSETPKGETAGLGESFDAYIKKESDAVAEHLMGAFGLRRMGAKYLLVPPDSPSDESVLVPLSETKAGTKAEPIESEPITDRIDDDEQLEKQWSDVLEVMTEAELNAIYEIIHEYPNLSLAQKVDMAMHIINDRSEVTPSPLPCRSLGSDFSGAKTSGDS